MPHYKSKSAFAVLSPRESELLRLFAEARTVREISKKLRITQTTVRNHTQAILRKLKLHTKLEAVVSAFRSGWVKP